MTEIETIIKQTREAAEFVYERADEIDSHGVGLPALGGSCSTKDQLRAELLNFLHCIADSNDKLNEYELEFLYAAACMDVDKEALTRIFKNHEPDLNPKVTSLIAFTLADKATGGGTDGKPSWVEMLITTFETLGKCMMVFDPSPVSEKRIKEFIQGMREYAEVIKNEYIQI